METAALRELYRQSLRIRMVEEEIAERYAEQEMRCPVHLSIGQEAAAAGVCAALSRRDWALSSHRSHGHYLAKGGDLRAMIAELYGKVGGCAMGKGGSMHLVDLEAGFLGAAPIVGSTIPIAVGAAFGAVQKREDRVTAAFFGEGATEEGVFHESLDFAVLKRLPVVFVCENNLYSVYSPLSVRQPAGRYPADVASAAGLPALRGDGNDAAAVHTLAREAVERARSGGGPTFLELATYRWREHCGPNWDDVLRYRPEGELEDWRRRCPVASLKERLLREGLLDERQDDVLRAEIEEEIADAFRFARSSPFPGEDLLLAHVWGPPPREGK